MVRNLPMIRHNGKEYLLDEDQMELRSVSKPWETIAFDDSDMCWIKYRCQHVR